MGGSRSLSRAKHPGAVTFAEAGERTAHLSRFSAFLLFSPPSLQIPDKSLLKTNRVLGTGENTTSPTLDFSGKYEGYLVQFKVKRGMVKQLEKRCRGQKPSRGTKAVSIIRQRYCFLERRVCKIQIRKKSSQYSLRKRSCFRAV